MTKTTKTTNLTAELFHISIEIENTDRVLDFIIRIPEYKKFLVKKGGKIVNYKNGIWDFVENKIKYILQFNKQKYSKFEITELMPLEQYI